jgi:hypothetical protein
MLDGRKEVNTETNTDNLNIRYAYASLSYCGTK